MPLRPALDKLLVALAVLAAGSACSPKRAIVNVVGNSLASGSSGWASDDDPELVRDATPFALKTIESLLGSSPKNVNLLTAATSGFTSYSYAFVESEAEYIDANDHDRAKEMRLRAKKLYLRAREYGIRGLDVDHAGIRAALSKDSKAALAKMKKKDVPLLYWTAAAWAAAISIDKTDAPVAQDLPIAAAMMGRVRELDPEWGGGAVYDFFISYDAGLPEGSGGSLVRAKEDFDKAVALSKGKRASPYLAYAEGASVTKQDRKEFQQLLEKALAVDPNADPDNRLPNLIAQRRARWLLGRADELFVE